MVASRVDEEISILRSWRRVPGGYDAISKRVNESIAELGEDATFADLAGIENGFDMGGFADYFAFMDDD